MTCRQTARPSHRVYYRDFARRDTLSAGEVGDAIAGAIAWALLAGLAWWVL